MVSTTELREAHRLQDRVRECVAELIDDIILEQSDDDGVIVAIHNGPSLIDQLRESLYNNVKGKGRASSRENKSMLDIEVLDLYDRMEKEWGRKHSTLEIEFKALVSNMTACFDLPYLSGVVTSLEDLIKSITNVLYPARRYQVAAACPACGIHMMARRDSCGEMVRVPALVVDGVIGCTCLACGQNWPVELLEHLARVIGCEPLAS